MKTRVDNVKDPAIAETFTRLMSELDVMMVDRTPDQNGRNNLLLTAPDGSIWAVAVDNLGALSTTKVYG